MMARIGWRLASVLVGGAFVVAWQLIANAHLISPVYLPGPDRTWNALVHGVYAAGLVCCNGSARITDVALERGLFTAAPDAADLVSRHADQSAGIGDHHHVVTLPHREGRRHRSAVAY